MDAKILKRLQRLHVAIGRSKTDVRNLPARIYESSSARCIVQDFSGGHSETELTETLYSVIHNIANLHDHLRNWGDDHGLSRESIHNFLKDSFDYCVIKDLSNGDKHGYPLRGDGWTRKGARLGAVHTACRLQTRPSKDSSVAMTLGSGGRAQVYGDGMAEVIITGEVTDRFGSKLGDIDAFVEKAIRHSEAGMRHFGVFA